MTKDEFVTKHRLWVYGLVVDAIQGSRHKDEAGAWLRATLREVEARLQQLWLDCQPTDPPAAGQQKGK